MAMIKISYFDSPLAKGIQAAHAYVRDKYQLDPSQESYSLLKQEFGCRIFWDMGVCYIEFDDEAQAILFTLRWAG